MRVVLFFLCFACIVYCTFAGLSIEPAKKDKNHPGHCYTYTYGLGAFSKGEQKDVAGQCASATCLNSGDIEYASCGAIGVSPPCKLIKGDLSKPYPDCCPKPSC